LLSRPLIGVAEALQRDHVRGEGGEHEQEEAKDKAADGQES
jgi:hypothetical protein